MSSIEEASATEDDMKESEDIVVPEGESNEFLPKQMNFHQLCNPIFRWDTGRSANHPINWDECSNHQILNVHPALTAKLETIAREASMQEPWPLVHGTPQATTQNAHR